MWWCWGSVALWLFAAGRPFLYFKPAARSPRCCRRYRRKIAALTHQHKKELERSEQELAESRYQRKELQREVLATPPHQRQISIR